MITRFRLGQALIDQISAEDALSWVLSAAEKGPCRFVVTPNSDHIVMLEHHRELQEVYAEAHLVLADGMPLVWASRLLRPSLPERVAGSELMPLICAAAPARGLKIFLLGAPPGVAEEAKRRLEAQHPGIRIVGCYAPPLGFEREPAAEEAIIRLLREADADIIFVGLGAPKQELWMHRAHRRLDHGVMLGIGAAIDFCAGNVKRAPTWMQRSGLEWFYRLIQEPRRLAKRYLRDTLIVWIVLREGWRRLLS